MVFEVYGMCTLEWPIFFWFNLPAGVRHGGLLSPVLFAVYMDPLILKLRKPVAAQGCLPPGANVCVAAPANEIGNIFLWNLQRWHWRGLSRTVR